MYGEVGFAIALGACLGSFLNVVILRYCAAIQAEIAKAGQASATSELAWRSGRFSIVGRSHCPACGQTLRWWELVPVVSFLLLQGRCHRCRAPISLQYPLVEISMAIITVLIAQSLRMQGKGIELVLGTLAIAALLIVLFVIDLKTMYLPDVFIGLLVGAVIIVKTLMIRGQPLIAYGQDAGYGLAVGAGFLLFLWLVTKGRGIGLGDVKLMIPLGLLFGVKGTITLLFLAYMSGGLIAAVLLLSHRASLKTAIPFGPFLCAAALVLLLNPHLPALLEKLIH